MGFTEEIDAWDGRTLRGVVGIVSERDCCSHIGADVNALLTDSSVRAFATNHVHPDNDKQVCEFGTNDTFTIDEEFAWFVWRGKLKDLAILVLAQFLHHL
jgi:hypothetical protein